MKIEEFLERGLAISRAWVEEDGVDSDYEPDYAHIGDVMRPVFGGFFALLTEREEIVEEVLRRAIAEMENEVAARAH